MKIEKDGIQEGGDQLGFFVMVGVIVEQESWDRVGNGDRKGVEEGDIVGRNN